MTVAVAVREESGALERASEPPLSVELVEGREAFNALEKEWNAAQRPLAAGRGPAGPPGQGGPAGALGQAGRPAGLGPAPAARSAARRSRVEAARPRRGGRLPLWPVDLAPLPLSGPAGDRTGGRGRRGEEARQPQAPSRKPVRGRGIETGRQVPPEPPAPAAPAGRAGRGQLRPARWKGRKAARLRAG